MATARSTRFLMLLPLVAACSNDGGAASTLSPLAQDGERVYQNVCVACHHGDPTQDGSLGPAIAGSSEDLLYAKVILGEYPPGYEPKRPGEVMPKFAYLKEQIPALTAYLDEVNEVETSNDAETR